VSFQLFEPGTHFPTALWGWSAALLLVGASVRVVAAEQSAATPAHSVDEEQAGRDVLRTLTEDHGEHRAEQLCNNKLGRGVWLNLLSWARRKPS